MVLSLAGADFLGCFRYGNPTISRPDLPVQPQPKDDILNPCNNYQGIKGTINQVLGDGIITIFGAAIAHGDHAARACYAALAMQTFMQPMESDAVF